MTIIFMKRIKESQIEEFDGYVQSYEKMKKVRNNNEYIIKPNKPNKCKKHNYKQQINEL